MKKILAMYLPQYYTFPENDTWWGKGFTDWTNVKKAKPLFSGHVQPKVPLNKNYYCLLDKEVLKWQADLAREYGVYGFCFYHYWFNGKMLLEKPVELLLNTPSIDIHYCLSWANESWARTWDGNEKKYLIKQEYGGKEDWESHFQYLVKFFLDSRYLKVEGKPILLLYTSSKISECEIMVDYWNDRIREYGIPGIHIVETLNGYQKEPMLSNSEAVYYFEPAYTIQHDIKKQNITSKAQRFLLNKMGIGNVQKYDAVQTYRIIEDRKSKNSKIVYKGTFSGWDNTPRKGKKGTVLLNTSADLFGENLNYLMNEEESGDYVFINAWNEWAEGAYLEPDESSGLAFLEQCKAARKN